MESMDNRIVYLINTLKVGGAAKMLKYVANLSLRVFSEISIISIYDDRYDGQDLDSRIKVVCLGFNDVNRFVRQFLMVTKTKDAIHEINPNYVCSFISHVCFIGRLATLGDKNIKYISAERGDPFTEHAIWKKIIKWTYLKSDYCFFQLDNARDFFGEAVAKKSFVIPNPAILNSIVKPYFGDREKTIVSAGRFSVEKRYCDLIDAFAIVHKKYPEYKLIIYGDGPMRESYKLQIKNLGIESFVSLPGYVDCFAEKIRKDGIFVLSSLFEGIPNALIEAMSVGIPCIATDCTPGGPAFLFNNQSRGLLVPVKNPQAISDAIISYIDHPELAKSKAASAVEIVEQLNKELIYNQWIQSLETILGHG